MEIRHPASEEGPSSQYILPTKARTFPGPRPPAILIVEDDAGSASVIAFLLRHEGCVVYTAASFHQALAVAAHNRFDVVLADLHLPDGDGRELMARFQTLYQLPGIAMTGDASLRNGVELRTYGFSHTLIKPLEFSDIFTAIRDVMMKTSANFPEQSDRQNVH